MRPPDRPISHHAPPNAPPKSFVGPFQIGECIGKGAFGTVSKGLHIDSGQMVAIKKINIKNVTEKALLASIDSEVSLLRKLNHRNIVKYLDCQRTDTSLFLILEYVEGGSLASILKKFGSFPESLCAIYIQQVLRGLEYLHDQGVVHRDIKGANTLTTKSGLVKLADFGVATKLEEVGHDIGRHQCIVGTPYWMAPELVEMKPPTFACDIWSVGCTVIEMVSGSPPYFDLQPFPALFRIAHDPHPPLPEGCSALLNEFLLLCFQKDLAERPNAPKLFTHEWIRTCSAHAQRYKNVDKDAQRYKNVDKDSGHPVSTLSEGEEDCDPDQSALMVRNMLTTLSLERDEFQRRMAKEELTHRSQGQQEKTHRFHYHYKFMQKFNERQGNLRTNKRTDAGSDSSKRSRWNET